MLDCVTRPNAIYAFECVSTQLARAHVGDFVFYFYGFSLSGITNTRKMRIFTEMMKIHEKIFSESARMEAGGR